MLKKKTWKTHADLNGLKYVKYLVKLKRKRILVYYFTKKNI